MKRTFKENVSIQIVSGKTLAKVEIPPGSLTISKFMRVKAKLSGKVFPTSAWNFPALAGLVIPPAVVRELGLKDGQAIEVQVEVIKKKKLPKKKTGKKATAKKEAAKKASAKKDSPKKQPASKTTSKKKTSAKPTAKKKPANKSSKTKGGGDPKGKKAKS